MTQLRYEFSPKYSRIIPMSEFSKTRGREFENHANTGKYFKYSKKTLYPDPLNLIQNLSKTFQSNGFDTSGYYI